MVKEPPKPLSDAQRLEFVFKHSPVFGQDAESTWMAFYHDGKKAVTEARTHRECIDNVTIGRYWYAA